MKTFRCSRPVLAAGAVAKWFLSRMQVHAEANALLNSNKADISGSTIYVTMFPCNDCAKLLIQAGVSEVVYHEVGSLDKCRISSDQLAMTPRQVQLQIIFGCFG
jgi:deoxycytidylate deaminase